jgi:hypothetical protein
MACLRRLNRQLSNQPLPVAGYGLPGAVHGNLMCMTRKNLRTLADEDLLARI